MHATPVEAHHPPLRVREQLRQRVLVSLTSLLLSAGSVLLLSTILGMAG